MFYKVSLLLSKCESFFFSRSPIIFLNAKSANKIFDVHFLSLMLNVVLEIFQSRKSFFNNSYHLEGFTLPHPLSMYLM